MLRAFVALIAVLGLCSCQAKAPAASTPADFPVNRATPAATPAASNFLHKTFPVSSYAKFHFEVPAHQTNPRLQGSFRCFVKQKGDSGISQQGAAVDVMVMNQEQFDEFVKTRGGAPAYSVSASSGQSVDITLPPTLENKVDYYLVFQNSGGADSKVVQADFTLSF